jgi:hypothetical protein
MVVAVARVIDSKGGGELRDPQSNAGGYELGGDDLGRVDGSQSGGVQ